MLRRTDARIVYYQSRLLLETGVAHAFSTRLGGISAGPFASMNLGNPNGCPVQDDYANIWENYRILQRSAGMEGRELCRVHQVHGREVAAVRPCQAFDVSIKADALVSRDPARALSVRIADCAPALVASRDGRTVAAVHAGWRGVVGGVLPAAIESMLRLDPALRPADLVVAVGPCIGMEAFEVGPEVLDAFVAAFGDEAPIRRRADGKGHADLRDGLRCQALAAGIGPEHIDISDRCTYRDREEFFSHRRENGVTGRMAALISPR